jgi:F-type H+-transporting ATPase subunit a
MSSSSPKTWFEIAVPTVRDAVQNLIPEVSGEYATAAETFLGACGVSVLLIVLALIARMGLNKAMSQTGVERYHAESKFSVRNIMEIYVGFIDGMAQDNLDKKTARSFSWLFCGMFIYIFLSNLIGILPGGVPPTQSISNNLAMSVLVLIIFVGVGVKSQGVGYFTHMMGPVWWLAPLIFVIELFGAVVVRPASLAVRLTGNMNGDHTVLGVTYTLSEAIGGFIVPVAALGLGTFVSFIQSFVFTLLTVVYIALSVHKDHDEQH